MTLRRRGRGGRAPAVDRYGAAAQKATVTIAHLTVVPGEFSAATLRASLVLIGTKDDLEDVQRFTRPIPAMPQAVLRQAQETAKAIESRQGADQNR